MATKRAVPKFRRATPAVRREALVEATLRCLKQYGHEGVSVRRISAAAGVSIGLINHHFPSKSGLVAVAYETLALSLQDSIRAQADNKAVSPRDRLSGFFRASFAPELLDPQLFNVWLVFWSMVAHSPEIRASARPHLRQVPRRSSNPCSASWPIPERLRLSSCAGCHRAVRAARRPVGRIEPEPGELQAARGDRALRGLGQCALQRSVPASAHPAREGARREDERREASRAWLSPHSRCGDHRRRPQRAHVCRLPRGGGPQGDRARAPRRGRAAPRSPRSSIRDSAIRWPRTRCRCSIQR